MQADHRDKSCVVMGVEYFVGDLDRAVHDVVERATSGLGGYACFCNVHVLMLSQSDRRVRRALAGAWKVFPDGAPVAWLQRQNGRAEARRVGGPDVMPLVLAQGAASGLRHVLVGSTPEVLGRCRDRLLTVAPAAHIVGCFSPPFGSAEERDEDELVAEIHGLRPHIVWCGLGAPQQELWAERYEEALAPAITLGVGAAFDFLAGTKQRAPVWMRRSGLEWLHRVGTEPRRLAGRYARTNTAFIARVARDRLRERRVGGSRTHRMG